MPETTKIGNIEAIFLIVTIMINVREDTSNFWQNVLSYKRQEPKQGLLQGTFERSWHK